VSRGRFIAFEGGEASGKSTQAKILAADIGAHPTYEPGATPTGRRLRELFLDPATHLDPRTEALLLAADRAQHVAEVIRPRLDAGEHVVTDRYIGSSLADQGFGRGLPLDEVLRLSEWATDGLWPDLVLLLDLPPEVAFARMVGSPDRLEREDLAFHRRVAEGFRSLAAADVDRWVVIDARGRLDEVMLTIRAAVQDRLGILVR
jgi:dTMP kinase